MDITDPKDQETAANLDALLEIPLPPRKEGMFSGADLQLLGASMVVLGLLCNVAAAALTGMPFAQ